MKPLIFFGVLLLISTIVCSQDSAAKTLLTPFEKHENRNYSASYYEAIDFYKSLSQTYKNIQVKTFGSTDSGYPLHEVIIDKHLDFDPQSTKNRGKVVLLINNGIHPGEPCGIDASMMLARDLVQKNSSLLDYATIVIIPVYNISGSLNRTATSRANQNGPELYGFRGNVKNLDLNRDFIKCDSKNALSFNQLFTKWKPQILIDNHTSNGADYPYIMTLLATQKDKLSPFLTELLTKKMTPFLYKSMKDKSYEMIPYVYSRGTPETGICGFLDSPRYSSGYASLHHTISFMPETHMLKPYFQRVESTYMFMESMLQFIQVHNQEIINTQEAAIRSSIIQDSFSLHWNIDLTTADSLDFKGYEAGHKPSKISGLPRLFYDRSKPFLKKVAYYNNYTPVLSVKKPKAYIFPQAFSNVAQRLIANGVDLEKLTKDTLIKVEVYYIEDFQTTNQPYEGHYLHSKIETRKEILNLQFYKGDYIVATNQPTNRYIVETLEPNGSDSFFAWNFFDGILMQKEHFSSYVFEDLAEKILAENPMIKNQLTLKQQSDSIFAGDAKAQLDFIYKKSKYYEATHLRYPVVRYVD